MILTALAGLYERMAESGEAPPPGFASVAIGAEVEIDSEGRVVRIASRLMPEGKRMVAGKMLVSAAHADIRDRSKPFLGQDGLCSVCHGRGAT